MGIFKRRQDPLSAVAALIALEAENDGPAAAAAREALAKSMSTTDILYGLHQFGAVVAPHLDSEQQAMVRSLLEVVGAPPHVQAAIQHIGEACLIDGNQPAFTAAVNTYLEPLVPEPGAIQEVVFNTISGVARSCAALNIQPRFS